MIRINLLGEKVDKTGAYVVQGAAYCGVVLLALSICFMLLDAAQMEAENLASEKAMLQKRLAKLEQITKEVEQLEGKKKLLEEKIRTIATLKAKKHGPIHVVDDINTALPERAWLVNIRQKGDVLELLGIALDNQTIANFMQELETKRFFREVDLVLSTEYIKDEVKLKQFTISVKLLDPLKAEQAKAAAAKSEKTPAGKA